MSESVASSYAGFPSSSVTLSASVSVYAFASSKALSAFVPASDTACVFAVST